MLTPGIAVHVWRQQVVTIPWADSTRHARELVAAFVSGSDPGANWIIEELPPSIGSVVWTQCPNEVEK